ncbi:hypothetical protein [Nocardioides panaciterrulae]|uniref:Uncharacterized protein n=1 Tax=Nocardioides panaciterrulae TaxID=661492 RepID=A0A7Y9EAV0_9ACTN|nr:hypothetical protein [Nocardioides panaciterrulae]NYD43946.1 hypothetical protein [Nocardioides panaciterrulae]NYD44015.1 hypothetical protein [Nocardioides panaciterrulae]
MTTDEPDIHTMMAELTRPHTHTEEYAVDLGGTRWSRRHHTRVPALVHQLLGATPARTGAESGSGPVSKPAARIEALDTLMLIDDEAGEWIDRLGGVIPADTIDHRTQRTVAGSGTLARLLRLNGLRDTHRCDRPRGHRDENGAWCCSAHHIEHDVRRWWHQARIITGWDTPAYRPFSTCPVCEHRGGLRINLELQAGFCVECRSVWDRTQIGLLAEHIRIENAEQEADTPEGE